MRIKLVFLDWHELGKSIYMTEKGVDLSTGVFHSGSTFNGEIELDESDAAEFQEAIRQGYQPCFWVTQADGKNLPEGTCCCA